MGCRVVVIVPACAIAFAGAIVGACSTFGAQAAAETDDGGSAAIDAAASQEAAVDAPEAAVTLCTGRPHAFCADFDQAANISDEVVAGLAVQTTDPASRRGTSSTKLRSHWNRRPWWRRTIVEAFQRGEFDVFCVSLLAGGTGLNLTSASYVIHTDPWWNPAAEEQATSRAHRMGQTEPVTVYRLVARGTIEEAVLAMHAAKRELASAVLEGKASAKAITSVELLELLRFGE